MLILFLIISLATYYFITKSVKFSFDIKNLNFRLFVLGANIIVIVYLIFQNTFYREIYLIFVIPFILQYYNDSYFFRFFFYLILTKYFFGILQSILFPIIGTIPNIVILKMILDFLVISSLSGILVYINLIIIREKIPYFKS